MELSELEKLSPDLFIQTITYLPFSNVISICSSSKILQEYCSNNKYMSKWKRLIDNTFSNVYNYSEKLKQIQQQTKSDYNYLVYTQLVNLLDPITKLMIYYKQGDMESFEKGTKEQKFLALFLLNKKDAVMKYYLLSGEESSFSMKSFIDFLDGQKLPQDHLNGMLAAFTKFGNVQGIQFMEKYGANARYRDDHPLTIASLGGQIEATRYLVSKGANIHSHNELPVRAAAARGHLDVVKYLHSLGADIHSQNDLAFRNAARNGQLDVVKYLVENDADIHADDDYAIRFASLHNHIKVIEYLLTVISEEDRILSVTKALTGASYGGHLDLVKYLVALGADVHYRDNLALRQAGDHVNVVNYLNEIIQRDLNRDY